MNNLQKRTVSGFFFVAIIIGAVLWSQWSFLLLFLLINILILNEFYTIVKADIQVVIKFYAIILGCLVFILPAIFKLEILSVKYYLIFIPLIPITFILELFLNKKCNFNNIGITLIGIIYICVPLSIMSYVAFNNGAYSYELILPLFIFTWINDIFAYLIGKFFGKRKLFERLSPLKTWEGFIGGMLVTILFAFPMDYFFNDISLLNWFILAIIVSISATLGDLVESMLKRNFNIKDSGAFLPGHGGFLDRFDALLFVIPFYSFFILFFTY